MRLDEDDRAVVLGADAVDQLVTVLRAEGYRTFGPVRTGSAIVFDEVEGAADLPVGWTDDQEAGSYRLRERSDDAQFGFAVGPESLKRHLFPPAVRLFSTSIDGASPPESGSTPNADTSDEQPAAYIGVRPCDIAATEVLDRVFLAEGRTDPTYERRRGAFLVVVNCEVPAGTCFCTSMGTGPEATQGADIALTELTGPPHRFLAGSHSERGARVLDSLQRSSPSDEDRDAARQAIDRAGENMGRHLETDGLPLALTSSPRHERWDDVADRCLACTNCTDVCPTCFCSRVDDGTDLAGTVAHRTRVWDSCFSLDHSYVHGGPVRSAVSSRYRQWLTHKFGTWHDQFGLSGCVGCGRCIAWCPVGIDVTEELGAIQESPSGTPVTIGGT